MRSTLVLTLVAFTSTASWGQAPAKKRVAIFDFDNAAIQAGIALPGIFQTSTPDVGKAAADLLITKLVQDGNVSVIERSAIDKLLAEQNLTNSNRTDPLTAAKLGRVLGVDGIILGTITHYDYDDKITGGGGGGVRGAFGIGGYSTKTKHDIKAQVIIDTRLVSPDTAEVLLVSKGSGEFHRKGVKIDDRNMNGRDRMIGQTTNPIMNDCLDKAIAQLATQLEAEFSKLPQRNPVIDGLVADATDSGQLVLNVGALAGVKVGDRLQIWRSGREVRDPVTGKVLMHDDTLLGEAVVTSVNDNFAIAHYSGTESVKVRDLVKSAPKKP